MVQTEKPLQFAGFDGPNTTPVPDVLFDELMLLLDNAELRVLLYIVRRTYGFKRRTDNISLNQMVNGITRRDGTVLDRGTGLSKASVARGLKGLLGKGIIVSRRNRSAVRGNEPTTYALRFRGEDPCLTRETTPLSHQQDKPLAQPRDTPLSHGRDTQETGVQETESSTLRIGRAPVDNAGPVDNQASTNGKTLTRHGPPVSADASGSQEGASNSGNGRESSGRSRVALSIDPSDRDTIASYIEEFAGELGDQAPLQSSVTRALNLYDQSGWSLSAFIGQLYRARGTVHEIADTRPVHNRMSYFFTVLADNLKPSPCSAES